MSGGENRTVLVTGGAGYVGSHTCKALAAAGHLPITYDNLCRGHRSAVRWGPFEQGELADGARLAEVIGKHNPAAVIHLAAFAYVGESISSPEIYYGNNVANTYVLLEAMRRADLRTIILSSSCAVYGGTRRSPIPEDARITPASPYGRSKRMIEEMIEDYAAAHAWRFALLRYFNAAGSDPDGEIGECHDPEPHIIPVVLKVALGVLPEIVINGNDYPTADGTCVRDFTHVADLAAAHVAALDALSSDAPSGAYNLGTGRGHSMLDVIRSVERVTGKSVAYRFGPRRPGDPPYAVGDARRAKRVLKWSPRHVELDRIVADAWRWMQASSSRPAERQS